MFGVCLLVCEVVCVACTVKRREAGNISSYATLIITTFTIKIVYNHQPPLNTTVRQAELLSPIALRLHLWLHGARHIAKCTDLWPKEEVCGNIKVERTSA